MAGEKVMYSNGQMEPTCTPTKITVKPTDEYVDLADVYRDLCRDYLVPFSHERSVASYDDTTLFCPAGMQKFKELYADESVRGKTVANVQSCIRLNDLDEIGDGTHFICFDMIGLFSFRDWSLQKAVDFWMDYMQRLGLKVDYVTIHPDKLDEWKSLYSEYPVEIRSDGECVWSDGSPRAQPAYCTEFYINGVEVGNIVNPRGDCIDAGFGYERLNAMVNHGTEDASVNGVLVKGIVKLIQSGFVPSNTKHGYVLRKLYTRLIRNGGVIEEGQVDDAVYLHYTKELERYHIVREKYLRLKSNPRLANKQKEFWIETHGVDPSMFE